MYVSLTDKGREVLNWIMPVVKEVVGQVMLSIGDSDAALLEKPLGVPKENEHHGLERAAVNSQSQLSKVVASSPAD